MRTCASILACHTSGKTSLMEGCGYHPRLDLTLADLHGQHMLDDSHISVRQPLAQRKQKHKLSGVPGSSDLRIPQNCTVVHLAERDNPG
jgi:hypothetical protein